MKAGQMALLSIISDGELHSGESLASQLNISRAAIWKSIKQLEVLGLKIVAEHSKGYRLERPIELLSVEKIKENLSSQTTQSCHSVEVLVKTESTNSFLFERLDDASIHGRVVLAEYQSQGRGRRGNQWIAPLGSGLMLSMGWHFDIAPKTLGLLSLYIGVAVARSLHSYGISKTGLKWPNDIVVMGKKIGGILLEVRGEASGPVDVIIGIGLNYDLPEECQSQIEQAVTDICAETEQQLSRNELTATLIKNVFEVLKEVEANDNLQLLEEWRTLDCYIEQHARLILPNKEIEGILKGVDEQGSLLLSVSGEIQSFNAGEISLRIS